VHSNYIYDRSQCWHRNGTRQTPPAKRYAHDLRLRMVRSMRSKSTHPGHWPLNGRLESAMS